MDTYRALISTDTYAEASPLFDTAREAWEWLYDRRNLQEAFLTDEVLEVVGSATLDELSSRIYTALPGAVTGTRPDYSGREVHYTVEQVSS